MRPMRCSIAIGFHGMSKLISVLQNCRLRPSPPDSLHSRIGTLSRNAATAASFSGPLIDPSNVANVMPRAAQQAGEMRQAVAMMHEHHLLLGRDCVAADRARRPAWRRHPARVARQQRGPAFVPAHGVRRSARSPPRRPPATTRRRTADAAAASRCCPPAATSRTSAVSVAITGGLLRFRRGAQGGGMTPRQAQRGQSAGVADHHAAHQVAQLLAVGRLARLAMHHVGGAEFLLAS